MKKQIALVVLLVTVAIVVAIAQGKEDKPAEQAPQIPDRVRQLGISLQIRAAGLEDAKAVLQREQDAVIAELQRQISAAQQACGVDYDVTTPTMTCTKKTKAK